jgi:hypothetical protein
MAEYARAWFPPHQNFKHVPRWEKFVNVLTDYVEKQYFSGINELLVL